MSQLLPYLIVIGALAAVMGFFTWPASLVRRRLAGFRVRAALAFLRGGLQGHLP